MILTRRSLPLLGVSALLVLAACAADSIGPAETPCPRGTVRNADGECVPLQPPPATDDERPAPGSRTATPTGASGATPSGGSGSVPTPSSDETPGTLPTGSGSEESPFACQPNATSCVDPITIGRCNASGDDFAERNPCPDGQICRPRNEGAACVIGNIERCTPGDFVTCATASTFFACADDGFPDNTNALPCPAATPNCRTGLGCTDAICTPDSRQCEGDQIVQCSADGRSTTVLETCPAGCAAGACIDPCAEDGKGSFIGCEFFAVFLDNANSRPTGCSAQSDCQALDQTCAPANCGGPPPSGATGCCGYASTSTNRFGITVSNATAQTVDVSVFDAADVLLTSTTIAGGSLQSIGIPIPAGARSGSRVSRDTFRVESTGAVTVHQFNPPNNVGAFSNDASLLLPTNGLGTDYLVIGWPNQFNGAHVYATVLAVAEEPTTVTVTARGAIAAGDNVPAIAPGASHTFTLARGDSLVLASPAVPEADLSGTRIQSDQPIAVFSGSECSNVPASVRFCDHMEQQLYPTDIWGSSYIGAKFRPRGSEPDLYRVMALNDNTRISTQPPIANVDGRTLGAGEFIDFQSTASFEINATVGASSDEAPIALAQFMVGSTFGCATCTSNADCASGGVCSQGLCIQFNNVGGICFNDSDCTQPGTFCRFPNCARAAFSNCAMPVGQTCEITGVGDPSFLLAVPTQQFLSEYVFFVPDQYQQNAITIVARSGTAISLNGGPLVAAGQAIAGTGFLVFHATVPPGVNTLTADRAVGLYVYGYDCDVSYAYPGGLNLDTSPGRP